ncbi:hypothetical protein DID77_00630 [Candidatus Marinamargulisbacteria bacterium SCGC AG-439-L15]|nr:hypothetical protein DID77_00630 [Candidatus Marinamargulisbacteria bacterium SCGC AG-439-L15]
MTEKTGSIASDGELNHQKKAVKEKEKTNAFANTLNDLINEAIEDAVQAENSIEHTHEAKEVSSKTAYPSPIDPFNQKNPGSEAKALNYQRLIAQGKEGEAEKLGGA